jgi:hypothetical protein
MGQIGFGQLIQKQILNLNSKVISFWNSNQIQKFKEQ